MTKAARFTGGGTALVLLFTVAAAAREMSPRQLRKNLKDANESWQEGRVEAALDLYEDLLAATEPGAAERPDALYALIVASLSPEAPPEDRARLQALFSEYAGFYPRHSRRLEVRTLRKLTDSAESIREENRRLEQKLAREREAFERERRELLRLREANSEHQSLEAEIEELRGKLATAEKNLAASRAELEQTRNTLAEKEKDLQKLRERIVDG